ncbi:hypothetical protein ACFTZB_11910, partial [Rhodococcus sp. NPDC057014]
MARNQVFGEDHGLGVEVVDESTQVAETTVDAVRQAKVVAVQNRGIGYWIIATAALVMLAEQSAFGFTLYSPVLGSIAAEYQTGNVVWVMTTVMLAGAVAVPFLCKLADVYGKKR